MSVTAWVADRVPTDRVHLDVAAAGRVSSGVLDVQVAHLGAEAVEGAYVAEEAARGAIDQGRAALAALVGLGTADVFFQDGASTALNVLLQAWPLERGARVATVGSEFGSNARALERTAAARGWVLVELPTDPLGRVTGLPAALDLAVLPQVASQRGVVQPLAELIGAGVPLLVDVAQALGQVEVPAGAAAYVGTSRKWLCGPRGVGFGVVDPAWHDRLTAPPTLAAVEHTGMRRFDGNDPHVAGRLGLSLAARTWSPALLPVLQAAASAARVLLEGAVAEPTGITTLTHADADPFATRRALVERGFVLSAIPTSRSADLPQAVLRVSTAGWVTPGDLGALAAALPSATQ